MIRKEDFGISKNGRKVSKFILENSRGNYAVLMDYGCAVLSVYLHDKNNRLTDVCLGFASVKEYEEHDECFGACIGRFAGVIKNAVFFINGQEYRLAKNAGANHIHGGVKGFDRYIWESAIEGNQVIFSRNSPHMEEGYPGNVRVKVSYGFSDNDELTIDYEAVSDQDTVLNLTNHSYFNLSGEADGSILDHTLQIFSDAYNETDEFNVPAEKISPVEGTVFDFRKPKLIGDDIHKKALQLEYSHGYDHNYFLGENGHMKPAARLFSPKTGIGMDTYTSQRGLQVYTGNQMKGFRGKSGTNYGRRSGICLETQFCPSETECLKGQMLPVLGSNQIYKHQTKYCFYLL